MAKGDPNKVKKMKRLLQRSGREGNEGRRNFMNKEKKNSFPEGIRKISRRGNWKRQTQGILQNMPNEIFLSYINKNWYRDFSKRETISEF